MEVLFWLGGGLAALGAAVVVGRRAVDQRAAVMLHDGLRDVERRVEAAVGGTASLELDGEPVPLLLALRAERVPAGRLVVERATLPNGLAVRRLVLTSHRGVDRAELVAHITPRAISRQLEVPGLAVRISRGRLRLVVALASVSVDVRVADGRVVLGIPVAPPPIGTMLSAGLTELVPRPPDDIELQDVRVVGDELHLHAVVDVRQLFDRDAID